MHTFFLRTESVSLDQYPEMVTLVGVRVLRGPDWDDGNQDGGEGHLGTITQLLSNHKVSVIWDNGNENTYRAGTDGKFDLRIFDTAQAGVQHPNHTCAECGDVNFYGTMWSCNECSGIDLCTLCYYNDKHDLRHQFLRVDASGSVGLLMKKRKASIKIRSAGLFPGAKVKRGKDWMWGDQDGGKGSEGEVVGFENAAPDSSRNMMRVKWSHGASNSYRIGYAGHVDILCVEEEPGLFYYRDHLSVLDTTLSVVHQTSRETEKSTPESTTASSDSSNFSSDGQEWRKTSVTNSYETSTDKQSQSAAVIESSSGESTKDLNDASTESSKVQATTCPDSERETTCAKKTDFINSILPSTVEKAFHQENRTSSVEPNEDSPEEKTPEDESEELSVIIGDYVAIQVGEDKLKELQPSYGGYADAMLRCLGRRGKVVRISRQQGVVVKFRHATFTFNPAALIKIPNLKVGDIVRIRRDIEKVKVLCEHVSWNYDMKETLGKVGRVVKVSGEGEVHVSFGSISYWYNAACCLPALGATPVTDLTENDNVKTLYRVLRSAMGSESHSESAILFQAIHQGNDEVVRAMCEADRSLIERIHQDITPLMMACVKDQHRVADVLLELGADVNHYVDDKTPLYACLQGKSEDLTKLLLERGADPFRIDKHTRTYIHTATVYDLPGAIRVLAEVGVDVNAKDELKDTALHIAISHDKKKALEALISLESIDYKVQNKRQFEVLHHACLVGNVLAVELILARDKSRVDVYFEEQSTPLHIAAFNDHFECVRLLVTEGGATIDIPDLSNLHTPLHLACQRAHFLTAEALLELGADVHIQDIKGDTPLHLAMGCRETRNYESEDAIHENQIRVGIACMLISRGAYCDVMNENGRGPLTYGHSSMQAAVKEFMVSNPHLVKLKTGITCELTATETTSTFQKKEKCDVNEALKGMGLPCGICFAPKSDVTLQPCQHKCVCSKCSEKVTRCPLCDVLVQDKDVTGEDVQNIDVEKFFKEVGIL